MLLPNRNYRDGIEEHTLVTCEKCHNVSPTKTIIPYLQLGIQTFSGGKDFETFDEVLANHASTEMVEVDCGSCKTKQIAKKAGRINAGKGQKYLIIQLKRFAFDMTTLGKKKL